MKKIIVFVLGLAFVIGLAACTATTESDSLDAMDSQTSLAALAYMSSSLSEDSSTLDTYQPVAYSVSDTDPDVLDNLDELNEYFDMLKAFIEGGTDDFASVNVTASDLEGYTYKMTITVDSEVYFLYYNIGASTEEITGILIFNDVQYDVTIVDTLEDSEEFFGTDETTTEESTTVIEEETTVEEDTTGETVDETTVGDETTVPSTLQTQERKMTMTATRNQDRIRISYKSEEDGNGNGTAKFSCERNIDGNETSSEFKVSREENEYKVQVETQERTYTMKMATEDGETCYKIQYQLQNGQEGEIKVTETLNEENQYMYRYQIKENGKNEKSVDMEKPGNVNSSNGSNGNKSS